MDRLNIGITGMSGFIGSALANFFSQQGTQLSLSSEILHLLI